MITTGAAPGAAIMKEELKNHPEKLWKLAGTVAAVMKLPPSLSSLILSGMDNREAIEGMVQKRYFSNIKRAVCAQNHWKQVEQEDGTE